MFKKLYLAAIAAPILLAAPAAAADYEIQETVVASSWTGFYIGAGVGVAWVDFDPYGKYCDVYGICVSPNFIDDLISNLDNEAAFRGMAIAGFDWEAMPGFLLGIQADYNFGQDLGFKKSYDYVEDDIAYYNSATAHIEDMWTLAGRFGWATDETLFYGLAGWSWANSKMALNHGCIDSGCWNSLSNSDTIDGWTVGAGVEFRNWLLEGMSTRFEYRYTDFGSNSVWGTDLDDNYYKFSADQNVQGFYLTMNYRFDGF